MVPAVHFALWSREEKAKRLQLCSPTAHFAQPSFSTAHQSQYNPLPQSCTTPGESAKAVESRDSNMSAVAALLRCQNSNCFGASAMPSYTRFIGSFAFSITFGVWRRVNQIATESVPDFRDQVLLASYWPFLCTLCVLSKSERFGHLDLNLHCQRCLRITSARGVNVSSFKINSFTVKGLIILQH